MRIRLAVLALATALAPLLRASVEECLPERCLLVAKIGSFPELRKKWTTNPASSATGPYFDYLAPMLDNLRQPGGGIPVSTMLVKDTADALNGEILLAVASDGKSGSQRGFVVVAKTLLGETALEKLFADHDLFVTREDAVRGSSYRAETRDTANGKVRTVVFKNKEGEESRFAWLLVGDTLVAGSETMTEDVAANLRNPVAANFTTTAWYRKSKDAVNLADAWILVNGEGVGAFAKNYADEAEKSREPGPLGIDKAAFVRALGLDALTGWRAEITLADDHAATESAFGWTKKTGVFALVTPVPGQNADPTPFVAGATAFSIDRSDIGARYRALSQILASGSPFFKSLLEGYPDALAKAGVDLRGGLIDNLGVGYAGRNIGRDYGKTDEKHEDDDYPSDPQAPLFLYNSKKPGKSAISFGLPFISGTYSESVLALKDGAKAAALLATLDGMGKSAGAPVFATHERHGVRVYSLLRLPENRLLQYLGFMLIPKHYAVRDDSLAYSVNFKWAPDKTTGAVGISPELKLKEIDALADDFVDPPRKEPDQPGLARALALLPAKRHALSYVTCGEVWTKYAKTYAGAFNKAVRDAGDDAPVIHVADAPKPESVHVVEVSTSSVEDDELVTRTVYVPAGDTK